MESKKEENDKNASGQANAMLVQLTTDGVPKLHCPVCNKALVSLNGYVKHVKKHEPPGGFECRYCDARFCSEEELKTHRDQVHTTIACRICKTVPSTTFTNASDYREHIRTIHNGVDRVMYTCDKCGAEYKTQDPFKRHMETECGKIKPHKCEQCQMTFVTKYNLKQHMETHTGERKFCCSFCGKSFLQKGRLVEHERSHTGQKPYKCDVCGKCFAHRESIVTHSSIHTGIRLVECRCCSSRFSCYSNLIKHRRTRPDTCGLPEYDPPKNRVRMRGSRIPATLNPTSEIKVSSFNKIIKPEELAQVRKITKKDTNQPKTVQTRSRKRKSPTKKRGRRKRKSSTSSSSDSENVNDHEDDDEVLEDEEEKLKDKKEARKPIWSDDSHDDTDNADFDPVEFDSDGEEEVDEEAKPTKGTAKDLNIKKEFSDDDLEFLNITHDFEYSDSNRFMVTDFNIKAEDDANIFSQKDKILRSLLNDDVSSDTVPALKVESVLLEETEVLLLKGENQGLSQEEDILAFKDVDMDCKVVLEGEATKILKLKSSSNKNLNKKANKNKSDVEKKRRGRPRKIRTKGTDEDDIVDDKNEKANESDDGDDDDGDKDVTYVPKRKYRKRGELKIQTENGPKRMAKLSTTELKERLKMLKKDEKSWQCPHCIKIYHMRKPFERHLREDHKRSEEEIREYMKADDINVINDEVFKCHICDKMYIMEKRLISHVKLHGDDGKLTHKCPCYCNLYFATKEEAISHAQSTHRNALYCEICNKFMKGHEGLKSHKRKHFREKKNELNPTNLTENNGLGLKRNFVCDKCGKKFTGRTSLTDHVRSDCGKKPLYPCNICGKHLTTAGILKTHMLLHQDETPFQCDKCGKTFKVKAQYKTHIKTRHTNYKPFKCHLCPKEYPYRESLLIHMTVHTGIKRFLCNGCGKRFTCISNLQAHRKVHADTCGLLPLNPKATQYMGVQKGNLLLGAKPEAGLAYNETNTLVAKEVIDRDLPIANEINSPSEPAAPLGTVPLTSTQTLTTLTIPSTTTATHLLLPQMMLANPPFGV